ncbi:MAG: YiiD C-terminal domain-containing protein [Nitrincola lacisaponensis]|uniref:YiiD C-terminal domain-containing protein n=1 Tax=Nitrincola lacisaponensis TaxID=267850 RepID=UPI00391CC6FA
MSQADPFLVWLNENIPLTRAMGISSCQYHSGQLTLSAPLSVNINDKGTGFAGATTALATLAGWSLITRYTRDAGLEAEVMIVESQVRYLRPVTADFTASVCLPDAQQCAAFIQQLQQQGKARLQLEVAILEQGQPALLLSGEYLARLKRNSA